MKETPTTDFLNRPYQRIRWILHLAILCGPIFLAFFRAHFFGLPQNIFEFAGVLLIQALIWCAAFYLAFHISGIPPKKLYMVTRKPKRAMRFGFYWFLVIWIGLVLVAWLEFQVIDQRWKWVTEERIFSAMGGHDIARHPVFSVLVYALAAVFFGLVEELWRVGMFRGVAGLFPMAKEKTYTGLASITAISLLYGMSYWYQGPFGAQNAVLLGFYFSLVILFRRSYWEVAAAHVYFNILAFGTILFLVLDPYLLRSQLIHGCLEGSLPQVRHLLNIGADPNVVSGTDGSPLQAAVRGPEPQIVRLLLQKGADLNLKSETGVTPLIAAAESDQPENVQTLVSKGADLNWRDNRGFTALRAAVQYNRVEAVRILINSGADPNLADNEGLTPLAQALKMGYFELFPLLPQKGSK